MFTRLTTMCLALLVAQPAAAFERMSRADCRDTLTGLFDMVGVSRSGSDGEQREQMVNSTRVTPQGWCQMRRSDPGFGDADFETFEWRAEGISRWTRDGIPPLALEILITGLDPDNAEGVEPTNRPDADLSIVMRQLPDAGQIIIERAALDNGAGDMVSFGAVFERVFLSSESMMQMSMGSAVFVAGQITMTLEGTHENPFGFYGDIEIDGAPQTQSEAAFNIVSSLPDGVIDDASRAELSAYAGDLPKPVGTLELQAGSERGLGLMQIGASLARSVLAFTEGEDMGGNLELMLSGLTISADWTPKDPIAD